MSFMRTTVDIPDPVYRQLKAKAALRGCSVRELILSGVKAELKGAVSKKPGKKFKLPLIESKHPGRLNLTNKMINELILPSSMSGSPLPIVGISTTYQPIP